jgi:predicted DCC family thiol-disulfide oxidoreductase YuxK
MEHYRTRVKDDAVRFVDITAPDFDARRHGLDPARVHRVMHVKAGGAVRTGVEAFVALWQAIPCYRWLARLVRTPGIHALATAGYHTFARLRPYLPRRKRSDCDTGTCPR